MALYLNFVRLSVPLKLLLIMEICYMSFRMQNIQYYSLKSNFIQSYIRIHQMVNPLSFLRRNMSMCLPSFLGIQTPLFRRGPGLQLEACCPSIIFVIAIKIKTATTATFIRKVVLIVDWSLTNRLF